MPIDRVFVNGIRGEALVGLLDWELEEPQPVEVDVEVWLDTTVVLQHEDLEHGVDFVEIISIVKKRLAAGHVGLVEVLADSLAYDVLALPPVRKTRITVRKFRACQEDAAFVGVSVEREAELRPDASRARGEE